MVVDGGWSEWPEWSACPVTCGGIDIWRYRQCSEPLPAYGGADCNGDNSEVTSCGEYPCPGKMFLLELVFMDLVYSLCWLVNGSDFLLRFRFRCNFTL